MKIINLNERLRKLEAARARRSIGPRLAKAERDAITAAEFRRPGGMEASLAALASEPNAAVRARSRAAIEALWRADT